MTKGRSILVGFFATLFSAAVAAFAADLPKPVTDDDFRTYREAEIKLGRLLFYDRVLSGTYRVSCATCHNPDRAGSNGFRIDRKEDPENDTLAINGLPLYEALKPSSSHAPALFNLGAKEFTRLFSDGRVERGEDRSLQTPVGEKLPTGVRDVLAAQALFPAVTKDEQTGTVENDFLTVAHLGEDAIWTELTKRVKSLPEYEAPVLLAYPQLEDFQDLSIVEIANAIGAFVGAEWRATGSAFDRYLAGDEKALNEQQTKGMKLFYGKGGCSTCHAGIFQSDHQFHTVGLPVWRFDADLDSMEKEEVRTGRGGVTGEADKQFSYRTPSLRNVEITAPYGHAGSYADLSSFLVAHAKPRAALNSFVDAKTSPDRKPSEIVMKRVNQIMTENTFKPVLLEAEEFQALEAFLASLTDAKSLRGLLGRPEEVPSGLALD